VSRDQSIDIIDLRTEPQVQIGLEFGSVVFDSMKTDAKMT
jgi:hypothetical protein